MKYISDHLVTLDVRKPIWDHFFTIAPLVIVGTIEEHGDYDLAPKHMATPIGWDNYFGFVCTPRHLTYQNIKRNACFTVSFPKPSQIVVTSLSAEPRCEDESKPTLQSLPIFPAQKIEGVFVEDGYLFLECELERIIDGFGVNSIIVGSIIAAHVSEEAMRLSDVDDEEVIQKNPLLTYLSPGRFSSIDKSNNFPFPAGFKR